MDAHFQNLRLTPVTNAKGSKSALISDSSCEAVRYDTKSFLKVPYNAGSFSATELVRWNLDLAVSDELRDFLVKLDNFVIGELAKNSEQYFKKKLLNRRSETTSNPRSATTRKMESFILTPFAAK